jgi:acyl-CoA thioesterase-2
MLGGEGEAKRHGPYLGSGQEVTFPDRHPMATLAEDMLRLDRIGPTTFRSDHQHDNTLGIIFGGQFMGQALLAASETAPGWTANSLGCYFLRPGNVAAPIDYEVELVRDGRSFANRRVVARQADKVLFDMICSFHAPGRGYAHQGIDIAGLPPPEDVPDLRDYLTARADRIARADVANYFMPLPIEFRLIEPDRTFHLSGSPVPRRDFWMRFPPGARIAEIERHQPLIAFISDFWIGPVANDLRSPPFPHRHPVNTTSHTMTFHKPARSDDWLLYRVESPWSAEGLGFTRGLLFDRHGTLVCATTQEVVMLG